MAARLLGLVVLVGACGAPGDEPLLAPAELRGALVGGREASLAEWPATVLINDGCTGAKVGPRLFLTAAHCVHDTARNTVPVGGAVRVTAKRAQVHGEDYLDLELLNIHVMQSWLDACQPPCTANVLSAAHPSDIALFEVADDSPTIKEAYVDISPVVPGDALVEVGYGCEDGYGLPFDYANRRLKVEPVVALPAGNLLHDGSFVWQGDEANVAASYVITPGFGQERGASLCPGDSGGPLYRDDATQRLVVGINAYYTFHNDSSGVSVTNWHTRVDDESRYGVATWLEQRGANLVDGCLPLCEGRACGDDGCGGSCGSCVENEACSAEGQCMCVPSCAGKTCGDDGCGGSCGECEPDAAVPEPAPDAGAGPLPPEDDEDEPDTETNIDEATVGEGDFCADHPGTPECAVPVTGKGCQLNPGPRKGESAAYLLFFALPLLFRCRRARARAPTAAAMEEAGTGC